MLFVIVQFIVFGLVVLGPRTFSIFPEWSCGIILMVFDWGLWAHGWLILGYALLLFLIFDRKSRREEEFLRNGFLG